ncbi:terminase TerL endonuclease subunit [Mycolicibacterium nivoides]|uniref:terminase TerL endonuclease subunit n=1 Tax=Mycolicibacterium nivoides TaxID=2487344 RepID=UPI0030B9A829
MAVYVFMLGSDDTSVDLVAVDERQAGIVFRMCVRFIERSPELSCRVQVFKDRLVIPIRGAELTCLPASPAALEGRNPDLCICDEGGRIAPEVYEVVALASGKKPTSLVLLIGTPGPQPDNELAQFRQQASDCPDDRSQVYREFSAAGFEDHGTDCEHCWRLANPALDDFLYADALAALQPPKMSENHFRRTRLVQWVTGSGDPILPPDLWDGLSSGVGIPDGADVVLSFDGSYSGTDATVLLAATVSPTPHLDVLGVWQRPNYSETDWRVPILDVEQAIRDACERWNVVEIAADPYRWQRSLAVLSAEGIPVVEFPQTVSRMSAATAEFLTACRNGQLSHSGDALLREHIGNAVLSEDNRGGRLVKSSRSRHAGRIDAAVCAVMAYSRASWRSTHPKKRFRAASFA